MVEQGVIQPFRSPCQSPLVPVPKLEGTLQLCIDYQCLKEMAVFDTFPMPPVTELIECIGNAHYITTLDLAKGYWQIPLARRDHVKKAFRTPWGLYELIWMLFGLHGAAATFQHWMDRILALNAS